MPRQPSKEKSPVSLNLIVLRHEHGLTQAQFAASLHVAPSTVGRWESWDPPRGRALERLIKWAESSNYPIACVSIAAKLRHEREKEGFTLPVWCRPRTAYEKKYIEMFVQALRDPMHCEKRQQILHILKPLISTDH